MVRRFIKDESGQTATEYMLIIAVLSLFVIKILGFFREMFLEAIPELGNIVEEDLRVGEEFK